MMLDLSAMVSALSVPDGGFSVDPRSGSYVRTGYAVAAHPQHSRILDGHLSGAQIHDFIVVAKHALAVPGRILGGWRDPETDRIHLDISIVTAQREHAMAIARATQQLAIFDLGRMKSCRVSAGVLETGRWGVAVHGVDDESGEHHGEYREHTQPRGPAPRDWRSRKTSSSTASTPTATLDHPSTWAEVGMGSRPLQVLARWHVRSVLTCVARNLYRSKSHRAWSRSQVSRWDHGPVIVPLLYQLTRRLLSIPAVLLHRDTAKDAELLVLRHENAVSAAKSLAKSCTNQQIKAEVAGLDAVGEQLVRQLTERARAEGGPHHR
jgi:hypothetical protein